MDDAFTVQEVKEVTLGMKNNKATGCDGIPTEASRILVTNDEGTEILMKLLNLIKNIKLSKRTENGINTAALQEEGKSVRGHQLQRSFTTANSEKNSLRNNSSETRYCVIKNRPCFTEDLIKAEEQ